MTYDVKNGRFRQDSIRVNGEVKSIYRGKTGVAERVQRPTKLDRVAGDQINQINEKIRTLYDKGYGDRWIAKILFEEDQLENPTGSIRGGGIALGPNVIKTQRHRLGVNDRVHKKKETEPDWKTIAAEKQSSIDELNQMLASTMDERDRYLQRLQECREQNYSLKFPSV